MNNKFLFFVIGPTNAGKSTFLNAVKEAYPSKAHLVEVGKLMRAKYHPDHFKGQANPNHTKVEALEMLFAGIKEGSDRDANFILVDGQPRDPEQGREIMNYPTMRTKAIIQLTCPRAERERRARERDKDNPASLQLALDRMDRDVLGIYEVLIEFDRYPVFNFNTNKPFADPVRKFQEILIQMHACQDLIFNPV